MNIHYIPTLETLRDLYCLPRDGERFKWYLERMIGENEDGREDVLLPLTSANPMGREHCLVAVERLLELDADTLAQNTFERVAQDFPDVPQTVRCTVTLLDDAQGGWTDRYLTEAAERIPHDPRAERGNRKRRFLQLGCWTSEHYTPERIISEAKATLYRYAYRQRHGTPTTLRGIMQLDGEARAYAGDTPKLSPEELAYTEEVLEPHLETTDYPLQFALLFGDEGARAAGYPPQGLAKHAGFELALHQSLQLVKGS